MLITVALQSTTMRYNGQLHRTPRYSRVPERDDHGAPRCVGRDGRMRPTVQRALGASVTSDGDVRRRPPTATSVPCRAVPRGTRGVMTSERRPPTATSVPCRAVPRGICNIRGCGRMRRMRRASLRTACASQAVHSSDEGRAARASHGPERRPPTASSDGDFRSMRRSAARHARVMPPNGDLRRRPPFHAARCRAARAAFATSEVADNQKLRFPVTIFRVGVKL
jgi:hypothetical protein